jgi:hypothetical protein
MRRIDVLLVLARIPRLIGLGASIITTYKSLLHLRLGFGDYTD